MELVGADVGEETDTMGEEPHDEEDEEDDDEEAEDAGDVQATTRPKAKSNPANAPDILSILTCLKRIHHEAFKQSSAETATYTQFEFSSMFLHTKRYVLLDSFFKTRYL